MDEYEIVVGLPHTNHNGLAEHLLLMQAGHFQWTSIARAIGKPLSTLRTLNGDEVYATFYFIEEHFPEDALLHTFKLDDRLRLTIWLRGFKGIALEGQILLDRAERLPQLIRAIPNLPPPSIIAGHPYIRLANIFITPTAGNSRLKVATPANADFSALLPLPNEENPYHITKLAQQTGCLGLLGETWECVDVRQDYDVPYAIDPDRDSNGAGLVYFANYIAFMDFAERVAMRSNSRCAFSEKDIAARSVQHRRVAYYGNATLTDQIRIHVSLFVSPDERRRIGLRYAITRQADGQLICLSEAIKVLA